MQAREPIFNAPAVVVWTLGLMVLVHVGLALLPERQWSSVVETMALIPSRYLGGEQAGGGVWNGISALVTHQVVHADVAHLVLNSAWMLAFGSAVASRIGPWRFLAFALLSGIAGALAFLLLHLGDDALMVGASGALAGLMGGSFRFLFAAFDDGGPAAFRGDPRSIRRMSLGELMRDRRAQFAIGFFVLLNFLTALLAPMFTSAGSIAWEAHLGGFLFGLLSFGIFDAGAPTAAMPPPRSTLH